MSGKSLTLLAVLAFVAAILGAFIWFVATWDKNSETSVTDRQIMIEERLT